MGYSSDVTDKEWVLFLQSDQRPVKFFHDSLSRISKIHSA